MSLGPQDSYIFLHSAFFRQSYSSDPPARVEPSVYCPWEYAIGLYPHMYGQPRMPNMNSGHARSRPYRKAIAPDTRSMQPPSTPPSFVPLARLAVRAKNRGTMDPILIVSCDTWITRDIQQMKKAAAEWMSERPVVDTGYCANCKKSRLRCLPMLPLHLVYDDHSTFWDTSGLPWDLP